MFLELFQAPHVSLDVVSHFDVLTVLGDTVVGQVGVAIRNFAEVEVSGWETNVGLRVDPDRQRVPVSH